MKKIFILALVLCSCKKQYTCTSTTISDGEFYKDTIITVTTIVGDEQTKESFEDRNTYEYPNMTVETNCN
jgi:hypothetical protein